MVWSRSGVVVGAAALCLALFPAAATAEDPPAYTPASGARTVQGTESGVDSPFLEKSAVYADTLGPGEKKYYRVRLDDSSNAFVSTVVAPPPGTEIGFTDGVRLSLTSTDGSKCGTDVSLTFGGESTRPVAGAVSRRMERDRNCQEAGEYLYAVEWTGPSEKAVEPWPLELTYMAEPGLKPGADEPRAPTGWSSGGPPAPSTMTRKEAAGGTGFNDAAAVREGVWQDEIRPGESRFYRVPVAWGQQLFLRAQLAGSGSGSSFFAVDGLRLELYNTARARVADKAVGYTGKPAGVEFGTAPAAYANRFAAETEAERAMHFQGWYYVQVTLGDRAREAVPLRLDVDLRGTAQSGPPYDGDPAAAGFGLGDPVAGTGGDPGMRVLGIAGIGTGTALVLGLGAWSYAARRRTAGAVRSR
ncbi:hypothetical protein [Streptomyces griseus]|uniref:hypothetical protein n=1 Tax=Streptomyces griseus TaxID=1911 RepID=UPI0008405ECD|nr:hypothetical protein [Streptomyces griseus]